MAIDFPVSPAVDQIYSEGGKSWKWNGLGWQLAPEALELGELVVLVTQDLNLYVATTGNDTTGDGTQALPWATPHRAMAFLSKCVLASGVTATVHVADGLYEFTAPLNLNHPQGTQIYINGTSTTGTRPTGAALNGGGVRGNTAATKSFNEAKLDAYYNTKWLFKNCIGVKCSLGGGVTIDKVLIKGDGSAGWNGVVAGNRDKGADAGAGGAGSGAINFGEAVAIHGFGSTGIVAILGGSLYGNFITITNNGLNGAAVASASSAQLNNATSSNNASSGAYVDLGSSLSATDSYIGNNGSDGMRALNGGNVAAARSTLTNNGRNGCHTGLGSVVLAPNVITTGNGVSGLFVLYGGAISAESATSTGNGLNGLRIEDGGTISAIDANTVSNTGTDVLVERAGNLNYVGGNSTDLSPAANTVGNGNGYISTV